MINFAWSYVNEAKYLTVRNNLALESIVVFWWIMFIQLQVTNIKGKVTGHLSALRKFRYAWTLLNVVTILSG